MKSIFTSFALLLLSGFLFAEVVIHPPLPGFDRAGDFRVYVDGKESFVANADPFAFTMFDFEGKAEIVIETRNDVKWVDLRPLGDKIPVKWSDRRISFTIDKPSQLSVELNGENERPLYIIANPLETKIPNFNAPNVMVFKAGETYEIKDYKVEDNQILYLEAGSLLKGMIHLDNVKNVKILGRGIIDGGMNEEWDLPRLLKMDYSEDILVEGVTFFNSLRWTVHPSNCKNVVIDNIKILNWDTGSDGVDINSSQNVTVKNSFLRCNDDCVVLKSMGERSYYPNEQMIAGNVDNILVENCVLWNMAWGNALEIGFELRSKEVKNIIFRDCDIINVERGAAISIHNGDWAHVHDVLYENIRIENAQHKIFDVAIFLSQYSYDRPADEEIRRQQYKHGAWDGVQIEVPKKEEFHKQFRGKISNITFRNISIMDGPVSFSLFVGYDDEHEIENVKIDNYRYYGRTARNIHEGRIFIRNIEDFAITY